MNQYTTKQIAEGLKVTAPVANGVIQFLVSNNIAKPIGKVVTGKVGKPSVIYEIPANFSIDMRGVPTFTPPAVEPKAPKAPKARKPKAAKVEATAETPEDNKPIGTLTENPAAEPAPESAPVAAEPVSAETATA